MYLYVDFTIVIHVANLAGMLKSTSLLTQKKAERWSLCFDHNVL